MSSINSIGAAGSSYLYESLSSGSRVNRAADGAAEMAISQEFDRQTNGYDVGARNMTDAVKATNIADGALSTITDSLQRIRELGVKASNGLMSDDDKKFLKKVINYKHNFAYKLYLLFSTKYRREGIFGTISLKIAILFNKI